MGLPSNEIKRASTSLLAPLVAAADDVDEEEGPATFLVVSLLLWLFNRFSFVNECVLIVDVEVALGGATIGIALDSLAVG